MNLPQPKHPGYTIEDWRTWDGRWELIKGVAYDLTPAPSPEHQRVSVQLSVALAKALEAGGSWLGGGMCEAFHARIVGAQGALATARGRSKT